MNWYKKAQYDVSSYKSIIEILKLFPDGINLHELAKIVSKELNKEIRLVYYDLRILLSACKPSRHKSCPSGFWIEKKNDWVKIRFDDAPWIKDPKKYWSETKEY